MVQRLGLLKTNNNFSGKYICNRPILSIAIPTYQRSKWLNKCLLHICHQIKYLPQNTVEVVVSDNASLDSTWENLIKLKRQYKFIKIFKNKKNIGAENNIYKLPNLCSGKWLWILGDDDFILPYTIKNIVARLKSNLSYIALNCLIADHNLNQKRLFWNNKKDIKTYKIDDVVNNIPPLAFGFISSWILKKENFSIVQKKMYCKFIKWGLSPMLDRYCGLSISSQGLILNKPMFIARCADLYRPDFNYFKWFFRGYAEVMQYCLQKKILNNILVRKIKSSLLYRIATKRILYERASRIINRKEVFKILWANYRCFWQFWFLCIPLLYIPGLSLVTDLIYKKTVPKTFKNIT